MRVPIPTEGKSPNHRKKSLSFIKLEDLDLVILKFSKDPELF